jgi:hypothetical protein
MGLWKDIIGIPDAMKVQVEPPREQHIAAWYQMCRMFYENNGLYDALSEVAYKANLWQAGVEPLRNPVYRVTEFYAKKLWPGVLPGALPIQTTNKRIIEPIHQVWKWSNFSAKKTVFARQQALFGDAYIKVATKTGADGTALDVHYELIKAEHVTDLDLDQRGYLTYLRVDIPIRVMQQDGTWKRLTHTEIWDKQRYRLWVGEHGAFATAATGMGDPDEDKPLSDFGIDFVPFVKAPFIDTDDLRGANAWFHALDKIDEANRQATRLHQQLYVSNKETWAIEADITDAAGRPIAPPKIGNRRDGTTGYDGDVVTVGDLHLWRLPSGWHLKSTVPPINFAASIDALAAQIEEIADDLPEMAYYRTRDFGDQLSGVALRLKLGPAVDRVTEARGIAEDALARANQMALTIGAKAGLFPDVGTYEKGDFDHSFAERPVMPLPETEEAAAAQQRQALGIPQEQLWKELGYTDDQIKEFQDAKQQAADAQMAAINVQRAQLGLQADQQAAKNPDTAVEQRLRQQQNGQ